MDSIGFSTSPAGVDPSSSSALLQDLETECKYTMDHNPSLRHAAPSDLPAGFDLDAYADQALNEMQCDLQPPFTSTEQPDYGMSNLNMAGLGPQTTSSSMPLVQTTLPMPMGSSYIIQKPSTNEVQKVLDTSQLAGISNTESLVAADQHYSTSSQASTRAQGSETLHVAPAVTMPTSSISMATTTHLPSITNLDLHGNSAISASLDTAAPGAMSLMLNTIGLNQQFHSSVSQESAGPTSSMAMISMVTTSTVSMETQTLPSIGSIMTTSAGSSHGNKLPGFKISESNINVAVPDLSTLNTGSGNTLPSLPATLKPRLPNTGSVRKAQDVMIYHDKVTGKNFLIPVGPAQPDHVSTATIEKRQQPEPTGQGSPGSQASWSQDTYSLSDLNVSKYLNIQTSASLGIASSAYVAASSNNVTSHAMSQTSVLSSNVEATSATGKTGRPEAGHVENKGKDVEKPTSSQDSVNILKSHLLRFIADGCCVDTAAKQGTDPDQTDQDGAELGSRVSSNIDDNGVDDHGEFDADTVKNNGDAMTCAVVGTDCGKTETLTGTAAAQQKTATRDSKAINTVEDKNTTKASADPTEVEETEQIETSVPATPVLPHVARGGTTYLPSDSVTLSPRYAAVMAVVNIEKMSNCGLVPPSGKRDFVVQIGDNQCIVEDGKRFWKCLLCPKQYATKHNLTQHILSHMDMKPHSCHICSKSFRQQSHLHTHMLTHTNIKPYSCSECRRGFTQASHLKRHMATHMQQRPHVCNACGRGFAFPSELKFHMDRHNNGQENLCDVCQEKFETPRKLKMHKATAHKDTEPLTCKECGKVCTFPSQLRDHMMRHEGTRPYTCAKCGMCFMKEHHLKAHQFTHSGLRPYVCEVCNRAFTQRANLQRHQLIHSAERKYKCEICDKAFTQPQVLKSHMTTHADCKPFKCKYCDKRFARMHNLLGHEAAHQGSKPHTCFCGSSFTLKGNLNRHKKVKHGVDVNVDCTEEEAAQILNELSKPRISEQDIQDIDLSQDSSSPSVKKRRKSLPHKKIPIADQKEDRKIWAMWQGGETDEDETDEEEGGDNTKEDDGNAKNISGSEANEEHDETEECDPAVREDDGDGITELEPTPCREPAQREMPTKGKKRKRS